MEAVQEVTRPSALVVALNVREEELVVDGGLCSVRVTGIEEAGLPRVVSRTWHVIGGLGAGVDIVGVVGCERCELSAWMRVCAVDGGINVRFCDRGGFARE